ncbi:MAG: N-acetylmuramoyl-L-alanine amidase [bacterium]
MKKFTTGLILILFACMIFFPQAARSASLNLVDADGSLLGEIPTLRREGSLLLDLYNFFRALDFSVSWNEKTRRLEVEEEGTTFRFTPRSEHVLAGDNNLYLTGSPLVRSGKMYLAASTTAGLLNRHTKHSVIYNPDRQQMQLGVPREAEAADEDPIGRFLEDIPEVAGDEMLVVIDPGHGGRDPGAIGPGGLMEKEVILNMSLRLKKHIEDNYPRMKVILTREEDVFIPLQDRTRMANQNEADVFISIHANSGPSARATGFEIFTLSAEASDPSAQERADIENSVLRYEGYDSEELSDVAWILGQLRASVHTMESQAFSEMILSEMEAAITLSNRGMKQAPFFVLKDAMMPAVLFEAGFLSNPREEQRLQSDSYQKTVVEALGTALDKYMKQRFLK